MNLAKWSRPVRRGPSVRSIVNVPLDARTDPMQPAGVPFCDLPPIDRYARVLSAMAQPGVDPEAVLVEFGLSAADWDELEAHCDSLLDATSQTDEQVLEQLGKLAEGLQLVGVAEGPAPVDFETWLQLAHACQIGAPLDPLLRARQVTLQDFLSSQSHWLRRMASDPELLERYQRVK
jgi:hypothetical protein